MSRSSCMTGQERVEQLNLNFLRQEIALRDFEVQNEQLIKMTNEIRFLTFGA